MQNRELLEKKYCPFLYTYSLDTASQIVHQRTNAHKHTRKLFRNATNIAKVIPLTSGPMEAVSK